MPEDVILGEDKDALAAEYVLGTLDADERSAARALLDKDESFASQVKAWERRLGELHLMVEPVEPEPEIWRRIKAKLPPPPPAPPLSPEPAPALPTSETVIALPHIEPEPSAGPATEREPEPETKSEGAVPDAGLEPSSRPAGGTEGASTGADKFDRQSQWDFEREIAEIGRGLKAAVAASGPEAAQAPATQEGALQSQPADTVQAPDREGGTAATASATSAAAVPSVVRPPAPETPAGRPVPPLGADQDIRAIRRRLAGWRVIAGILLLAILAAAALPALWKYAPDRVPPELRPVALMRSIGIAIDASPRPRQPAPPESQFDE